MPDSNLIYKDIDFIQYSQALNLGTQLMQAVSCDVLNNFIYTNIRQTASEVVGGDNPQFIWQVDSNNNLVYEYQYPAQDSPNRYVNCGNIVINTSVDNLPESCGIGANCEDAI